MGRAALLHERILIRLVQDVQWEIDDHGRIWRNCIRLGRKDGSSHLVPVVRRRVEKRLPKGYLMVRAMIEGKRVCGLAHRLVWQHFNGDIPIGQEINHDNGLKDDNRPINLLCGTGSQNLEHAFRHGLHDQHGQKNPAHKLTDNEVAQIRLAYANGGYTMERLGERFGVTFQTVSDIVRGKSRAKQGGPTASDDLRHNVCDRDPASGRYMRRKIEAPELDGRQWAEFPKET